MQGFSEWTYLATAACLNLKLTLRSGQVFTWSEGAEGIWRGVIGSTCFLLKNTNNEVHFSSYPPKDDPKIDFDTIRDFLQLHVDVQALYQSWAARDQTFFGIVQSKAFQGLRVCRQDPFECLMAFIISQNNNAKRITSILTSVRERFGKPICTLPDGHTLFTWPSLSELVAVSEETWREMGLGYRAKYFAETTRQLQELGGPDSIVKLRGSEIEAARSFLLGFKGIGRKVGDCIALFSLDFPSVVPCDVHVLNIANRLYFGNKLKGQKDHDKVQEKFHAIFGEYAGWAHSVMFAAEFSGRTEIVKDAPLKNSVKKEDEKPVSDTFDKENTQSTNKKSRRV